MNMFRLKVYRTEEENKYAAEEIHELLGDRESIFFLWIVFRNLGYRHIYVYNMDGVEQIMSAGIERMS